MNTTPACDRCNGVVRSTHAALLPSGQVLRFCGHHAIQYTPALAASGATVHADIDVLAAVVA